MTEYMARAESSRPADKYEQERKVADTMEFFLDHGHQLYQSKFASEQQRDARFAAVDRAFAERLRDVPEMKAYIYDVGGPTAMSANMIFDQSEEDQEWLRVAIARSRVEPMKGFPAYSTARVRFESVSIRKGQEVSEDGSMFYYARPEINFSSTQSVTLQDRAGGRPLQFNVQIPVVVPCDGQNEIAVPVIEQLKTRANALGQIALKPANKRLVGTIHKLVSAMEAEKDTFIELKKPQILHEIAKQSSESDVNHDTLATAIRAAFGSNRHVRLEGEFYLHEEHTYQNNTTAAGAIIDVLPKNPATEAEEPTLVIEESAGLKYAPLSKVKRLEF